MTLPYAETVNYWKSGSSTPDTWLDKAEKVIKDRGGEVVLRAEGTAEYGKTFLVDFKFGDDPFRIIWPVLPSRSGNEKAAKRQAATLIYHEVKARSLRASIFGNRAGYFDFLLLPNGQTVSQLSTPELLESVPKMIGSPK